MSPPSEPIDPARRKLSPWQNFVSGAMAGMSARMCVAPLDVLKIRFQVQPAAAGRYRYTSMASAVQHIVANEGLTALWKGNVPALFMVTPYAAIQMACFYQLRQSTFPDFREPYSSLVLGAVASSTATLCTYPLDLLRTRLAAQSEPKMYHGLRHAVSVITASRGPIALYDGLRPTLMEIVPYISLHFALYENIKAAVLRRHPDNSFGSLESLLVGAISGTTSKALTLPLDNAKKLMQVETQFARTRHSDRTMLQFLRSMWTTGGTAACFRGLTPSLVKAAPNSAITFAVYERAKRYFTTS